MRGMGAPRIVRPPSRGMGIAPMAIPRFAYGARARPSKTLEIRKMVASGARS